MGVGRMISGQSVTTCLHINPLPCYTLYMNNDQLDDLKQFISASLSQSETRLREELKEWISTSINQSEGRLHQEVQTVRQEMADGFLGVGEAIEEIHQQLE